MTIICLGRSSAEGISKSLTLTPVLVDNFLCVLRPARAYAPHMIVLAVDTSGKNGSIALARVSATTAPSSETYGLSIATAEVVPLEGGTFSAQLVPQVAAMLARHRLTKADITGFAVVSGPGSFTGLRVGLAAVKALAEITQKPVAAVSLLEAVALSGNARGPVIAALDAGRGEIYAGQYELTSVDGVLHAKCVREQLLLPNEVAALASGRTVVTPDEKIVSVLAPYGLTPDKIEYPRSDAIAGIGWKKIESGETISAEELEANYIRRSDAEIFAK